MNHDTRVGYRIRQTVFGIRRGLEGYYAACDTCGWDGPLRDTEAAAEDDELAHCTTANPEASRS